MPQSDTGEIRALTSVRMVAALLVILHHFSGLGYPRLASDVWQAVMIEGHIGVNVFFVLSGFLIAARYYDSFAHKSIRFSNYFVKRVARIYPLYYVILILAWIVALPKTIAIAVVGLTFTQGLFSGLKFSGVPTAWSLTVEESFYLLAPLIFISLASLSRARFFSGKPAAVSILTGLALWVGGLFAIGQALRLGSMAMGINTEANGGFMSSPAFIATYTIFGRFFDFAVGIACAFAYRSGRLAALWERRGGGIAASALSLSLMAAIGGLEYLMNRNGGLLAAGLYYTYPVTLLTGLWILTLTCPSSVVSRVMGFGLFVYLGRISYALYLIQLVAFGEPVAMFNRFTLSNPWLNALAYYVILNMFSIALYEFIEKPCRTLILRHGGRWLKRPQRIKEEAAQSPGG